MVQGYSWLQARPVGAERRWSQPLVASSMFDYGQTFEANIGSASLSSFLFNTSLILPGLDLVCHCFFFFLNFLILNVAFFHFTCISTCRAPDTVMSIKWIRCRCWDQANPSRGFRECCSFSSLGGPGRFSPKREGKAAATLSLPSKCIDIYFVLSIIPLWRSTTPRGPCALARSQLWKSCFFLFDPFLHVPPSGGTAPPIALCP